MVVYKYKTFEDFMQAVINISNQNCMKKHSMSLDTFYKSPSLAQLHTSGLQIGQLREIWLDCLLPIIIFQVSKNFDGVYSDTQYITQDVLDSAVSDLLSKIENIDHLNSPDSLSKIKTFTMARLVNWIMSPKERP